MNNPTQVVRIWKGTTQTDDADRYSDYLVRTGLPGYVQTPGNQGAYFTRRIRGDGAEFCLITIWESMDAVREFAGAEPERAVFYPEDDRYLIDRDLTVDHFDVFASTDSSARVTPTLP